MTEFWIYDKARAFCQCGDYDKRYLQFPCSLKMIDVYTCKKGLSWWGGYKRGSWEFKRRTTTYNSCKDKCKKDPYKFIFEDWGEGKVSRIFSLGE
jgi:hypothetical protein